MKHRVVAAQLDFSARFVKNQRHPLVLLVAGFVHDGAGEKLHQYHTAIRRERKPFDKISERRSSWSVFISLVLFSLLAFFILVIRGPFAFPGSDRICDRKVFALKNPFTFATRILNPNIIALHVVFFVSVHAANGVDNAAVGSEGECRDVFVDGGGRLIQ